MDRHTDHTFMEAVLAEIRAARAEAKRRASELTEGSPEQEAFLAWADHLTRLEQEILATEHLSAEAASALFSTARLDEPGQPA